MTDIAPELWEKISAEFEEALKNDKEIARLYEKIRSGKATYEEAQIFSQRIGKLSSLALTDNITAEALPDGKMYFNIAERTVRPALERDYELISDVSAEVQASLNEAAGIGMNPVIPEMNEDRVSGLIDKLTEDGKPFDDVRSFLEDPVMNFCQNIVDESVRANAEMHYTSGLTPKIKRIMTGHKACEFCIERAGEFKYPLPDNRIYQRHENCRCLVLYDPGNGKYQDAHSKKYFTSERDAVEEKLRTTTEQDNPEKSTRKESADTQAFQSVMPEYLRNATPGVGEFSIETGYNLEKNKNEYIIAKKIHETFGGDITLVREKDEDEGVKNPDYIWRGKLWDLKQPTSVNAVDRRVRKGLKQIADNPGGLIVDYHGEEYNEKQIKERIIRRTMTIKSSIDIIIMRNGEFKGIYRVK